MNQIVAVLLIASGAGVFSYAVGGVRWGAGVAGLLVAVLASVVLLDLDGDSQ